MLNWGEGDASLMWFSSCIINYQFFLLSACLQNIFSRRCSGILCFFQKPVHCGKFFPNVKMSKCFQTKRSTKLDRYHNNSIHDQSSLRMRLALSHASSILLSTASGSSSISYSNCSMLISITSACSLYCYSASSTSFITSNC